jgi:hypothetical protein
MEEQVFALLSTGDEAEALVRDQLLDGTVLHGSPSSLKSERNATEAWSGPTTTSCTA